MTPEPATILLLGLAVLALAFAVGEARRGLRDLREALRDQARRLAELESRRPSPGPRPERRASENPSSIEDRDAPESPDPLGRALIAVPDLSARRDGRESEPGDDAGTALDRRYGGLWELADSGASPRSIAHATGMPVGRVELILGLRRRAVTGDHPEGRRP